MLIVVAAEPLFLLNECPIQSEPNEKSITSALSETDAFTAQSEIFDKVTIPSSLSRSIGTISILLTSIRRT